MGPSTQTQNVENPGAFTGNLTAEQLQMTLNQFANTIRNLEQKVQQHDNLLERLDLLESQNQDLRSHNQRLQNENAQLKSLLESRPAASSQPSPAPAASHTSVNGTKTLAQIVAQSAPAPRSIKKRISAARAFHSAATQGPKGFEYVYLGRSRKISRSEVRSRLRRTGIDTSRVIDICFPASSVIGVLLHVQYKEEFLSVMTKAGAEIITEFDPTDPANLANPKFAQEPETDRSVIMMDLVHKRCMSTLEFIRPVLVQSVGRFFINNMWIDDSDLDTAVQAAAQRLALENPKKAAFAFRGVPLSAPIDKPATTTDSDMDLMQ